MDSTPNMSAQLLQLQHELSRFVSMKNEPFCQEIVEELSLKKYQKIQFLYQDRPNQKSSESESLSPQPEQ